MRPVPDRRAGALGRPGRRGAAVPGAADPGGRAVSAPDPAHRRRAGRGPRRGRDHQRRADPGAPRPDRRGRRRACTRSCTSTPRARSPQAAASDERRAAGRARVGARRRPDRRQGRARHRGPAHDVRLEDPRGLGPAVRRHGGRAASRRPACRSSARPTWTSSRWAPRPSTPPTARPATRGTSTGSPAAPAAARPRRSPPSRRRSRSAPTPAARSASPARSPAPSGSSRPTAGSRATGWSRWPTRLDQAGPVTRTVLDAALLHEIIGGHDPLDSTSIDQPVPALVEAARAGASGDLTGLRIGVVTELGGEGYQPGVQQRFDEAVELLVEGRGRDRAGVLPELRARARGVLPDHAERGVLQPRPLRRDALRPAGAARRRGVTRAPRRSCGPPVTPASATR